MSARLLPFKKTQQCVPVKIKGTTGCGCWLCKTPHNFCVGYKHDVGPCNCGTTRHVPCNGNRA